VPCIVVEVRAFANRDQFKNFMEAGLTYFKAQHTSMRPWGWVADTRNMSAIPAEVQRWLAEEWNVQAFEAGLREMSIVTSQNVMGQVAVQQYAQKAVLEPVYYSSLAEAKNGAAKRAAFNTRA
jgi:hypothetical protein